MRRLWKASKIYHVPLTDPLLRDLNAYDLSMIEYLEAFEDPEVLKSFKNRFYDDDFEDYWNSNGEIEDSNSDTKDIEPVSDEWVEVTTEDE